MAETKKPRTPKPPDEATVPPGAEKPASVNESTSDTAPAAAPMSDAAAAPVSDAAAAPASVTAPAEAPPKPKKAPRKKEAAPAAAEPKKEENLSLDPTSVVEPIKIIKAKGSKNVHTGVAHVLATFNNTIVSITDLNGSVIGWSTAGKCGFKGSRKSTAYAAQMVAQDACRQAMGHGLREVEVRVKGPGAGRESAVRAIQAVGLEITIIKDVTPVPHNGCRPPKQRRV